MLTFSHPGSRIQGSKRHPIPDPDPDPQHCTQFRWLSEPEPVLTTNVADPDPGSGAFLNPDPGWVKIGSDPG
jgi:hypothetical protein